VTSTGASSCHPASSASLRAWYPRPPTNPSAAPPLADPGGYGLGIFQLTLRQTGTVWYYEGQAFGAWVLYFYFPRSGIIIALAANDPTDNDDLQATAISVYQTLQKAGAVHTG
jgi:D-alanyl-D-alanine carboxypeptidase